MIANATIIIRGKAISSITQAIRISPRRLIPRKRPTLPKFQQKRAAGRPRIYEPAYCPRAHKLALLGLTDVEIAEQFGISPDTLYEWKTAHPEFSEALRNGKTPADAEVAASHYQRALGYEREAVKIFMPAGADAPVYAPYMEHYPGDVGAQYHRARGTATIPAVKIFMPSGSADADGNPVPVYAPYVEHAFADVNAGFRWLYNRQPERWRDRRNINVEGAIDVRLAAMTPDERAADAVALVQRIQAALAASRLIDADNVTDAEEE